MEEIVLEKVVVRKDGKYYRLKATWSTSRWRCKVSFRGHNEEGVRGEFTAFAKERNLSVEES